MKYMNGMKMLGCGIAIGIGIGFLATATTTYKEESQKECEKADIDMRDFAIEWYEARAGELIEKYVPDEHKPDAYAYCFGNYPF